MNRTIGSGLYVPHASSQSAEKSDRLLVTPCLDFDDAGVAGEPTGDIYPNPIGGVRSEAYSALDQIVSAYRRKSDPSRSIPALDCKAGYAISVKS